MAAQAVSDHVWTKPPPGSVEWGVCANCEIGFSFWEADQRPCPLSDAPKIEPRPGKWRRFWGGVKKLARKAWPYVKDVAEDRLKDEIDDRFGHDNDPGNTGPGPRRIPKRRPPINK